MLIYNIYYAQNSPKIFLCQQFVKVIIVLFRRVFVMDPPPLDMFPNNFPEECLDKDVSRFLRIQYLSVCEQN